MEKKKCWISLSSNQVKNMHTTEQRSYIISLNVKSNSFSLATR